MAQYVSKQQQIINLLDELKNTVTKNNVDIAISILRWTKEKIQLDFAEKSRQFINQQDKTKNRPRAVRRGEIYGCNLGKNVGSEQNGHSRPVIVIQNTVFCSSSSTVIVVPLTDALDKNGNPKKLMQTHIPLSLPQLTKPSVIKLENTRCIAKVRLNEYIATVEPETMKKITAKLSLLFGI